MKLKKENTINLINDYNNNTSWLDMQNKYGISDRHIRYILAKSNIKPRPRKKQAERRIKLNTEYNVNPDNFIKNLTAESVYILGLIWADGYVNINKGACPIVISTTYPDSKDIIKIINTTGKWGTYRYKNKKHKNWKDKISITTNNYIIANYLINNNYQSKSIASADKILSKIPENLRHYWFRGLFDGDGYLYHKTRTIQCGIASSYEQDWTFLEKLCNQLNVKYTIKKQISKKQHKSSTFRFTGKINCLNFLNYIYQNTSNEQIYLHRKYNKYLNLIEYIKQMNNFHLQRHNNALERNTNTASNSKIIKLPSTHSPYKHE